MGFALLIAGSMMVGLARQDLVGPEQLLEQHHARELVGQRHRAEREPVVAALQRGPERAADHEAHVAPGLPALLQPAGERLAVVGPAAVVEQRHVRALGDPPPERGVVGDLEQLHPGLPPQQAAIVLDVVGVRRPHATDREHDEAHMGDTRRGWTTTAPSATSTSTPLRRRWPGRTRTSRTSRTPTTSSPSPSPAWTTRSSRARCPASWSPASTSLPASCAS